MVGLASLSVASVFAWYAGYPLLMVAAWIAAGFLGHAIPLASHDASHGTLHPSRKINEWLGIAIGTAILVPRSVYRYAHAQHHTHIGTEKDPELWPFTIPGTPLWVRRITAFVEIVFGFLYTPLLFVRSVVVAENLPDEQRKLVKREYALIVAFWSLTVGVVAVTGVWTPFLVGVVGPWFVAGMFQSLNKYVEHMGMMGVGVVGNTRSVIPDSTVGRSLAEMWQNVAYHGTHHLYAKIPFYHLPDASEHVLGGKAPEGTLFSNYLSAFTAMLLTLKNPRVGAQWKTSNAK
jgi:fatty acid desaturase